MVNSYPLQWWGLVGAMDDDPSKLWNDEMSRDNPSFALVIPNEKSYELMQSPDSPDEF